MFHSIKYDIYLVLRHLDLCYIYLLRMKTIGEKATGGGSYKYADLFMERLGITLDKEDEMDCLVAGANFLLEVGS